MRILNRDQFLKEPSGTFFLSGKPHAYDDLRVKFQSLRFESGGNDFVCASFDMPENDGSEQLFNRFARMEEAGESFPLELDCAGRDGIFDMEDLYLVYDLEDMIRFRDFISEQIEAVKSAKGIPHDHD
jgi:hypothetical protein